MNQWFHHYYEPTIMGSNHYEPTIINPSHRRLLTTPVLCHRLQDVMHFTAVLPEVDVKYVMEAFPASCRHIFGIEKAIFIHRYIDAMMHGCIDP